MASDRLTAQGAATPTHIAALFCAALLCIAGVALAASPAGAVSAGYGTGKNYCAQYPGGTASNLSFDNVWACGGTTTGNTTFDAPGRGVFAWQCVELSARFLWAVDGIWAGPNTGYTEGAQLVARIHALHPTIAVGSPGPGSVPAVGDVASFGPRGAVDAIVGHTAIVIAADPSTGKFETLSENFTSGGGDGAPGLQYWQVRLSGGENGRVQFLGGPQRAVAGAWTTASWLELLNSSPGWALRPMVNRGGSSGSTVWKVASSGTAGAWAVGASNASGTRGVVWRAAPTSSNWAPFAAPTGPTGTQFIDVSTAGKSAWVLGTGKFVLEWDGARWQNRSPTTLPSGFSANAILAEGPSSAWLVGGLGSNPASARWNGTDWQLVPAHIYAGRGFSNFDAVAAIPGTAELIAGGIRNAHACEGGEPMAQLWTGQHWANMSVPVPRATLYECNFEPAPALDASWFSIPGTISGSTGPVIYHRQGGSNWALASMDAPPSTTYFALAGFADASATSSWAVGQYFVGAAGSGTNYPLIEHWNGKTWTRMDAPPPTSNGWMTGVSVIPGSCEVDAVGDDSNALGATNYPFGAKYC